MFKNVASQSIALYAFDSTTGAPKTGDAANMLFYITKDWGSVTAIAANSGVPTEMDATNAKGWYKIAVSQTETNADAVALTGKSSTANIVVNGQLIYTDPPNYTTLSVDGSGRVDVIKVAGTTQTARDLGASVLLSSGTGTGQLSLSSGTVTVGTNNDKTGYTASTVSDKTGYSLTQTFPANFSATSIDASGNVATTSNIKKNTAKAGFMFVMTDSTTHAPKTGVTVTSTRSIDGAAFASTTNSATEVATGTYVLNLSAADTNGDHIMLRFTGTASDDLNIEIVTQP